MERIYLDSETTGLSSSDKMVELAIIDDEGHVLINTLLDPQKRISQGAYEVHGISDDMVADAPTLQQLESEIIQVVENKHVIIYNAKFDLRYLTTKVKKAMGDVSCCMEAFAPVYGEWNSYRQSYKWQPLPIAAKHIRYKWEGTAHRALSDTLACRAVWHWLEKHTQNG